MPNKNAGIFPKCQLVLTGPSPTIKPKGYPKKDWDDWIKRLKKLESQYKQTEKTLSEMFIQAVVEYDGHKIIELADAVWFFKKHLKPKDPLRHSLLGLKFLMKTIYLQNEITIKEVVEHLKKDGVDAKNLQSPEDG